MKAGQKAAPVSVGCVYVIDLPSGGNLTHTLTPDNRDYPHGESHALFGCRVSVSGGPQEECPANYRARANLSPEKRASRVEADNAVLEPAEVPRKIPPEEPLPDGAPRPGWENLRVAVGSPGFAKTGCAYIFNASTGHRQAELLPTDPLHGSAFGGALDIRGDLMIVGAPFDAPNGGPSKGSGSVYVFDSATTGDPTQVISVRGDPSFVVKEGARTIKKEQFWLPTSTAVPLLTWDNEATGQGKLVLKGETFSDDAASEWFKSFSLEVDGEEVLALSSLGNETGARNPESSALSTMRILIDGTPSASSNSNPNPDPDPSPNPNPGPSPSPSSNSTLPLTPTRQ